MEDRKQQIENIILKELHDREIMERVCKINEARRTTRLKRQLERVGARYNPDEVRTPNALANVLKLSRNPELGSASDSSVVAEVKPHVTNPADAVEDKVTRAFLGTKTKSTTPKKSVDTLATIVTNKVNKVTDSVNRIREVLGSDPDIKEPHKFMKVFTPKRILDIGNTKNNFSVGEIEDVLKYAHNKHPHIRTEVMSLAHHLGIK